MSDKSDECGGAEHEGAVLVTVRLPWDDVVELKVSQKSTVSDLAHLVAQRRLGFNGSKVRLLLEKQEMEQSRSLEFYNPSGARRVAVEALVRSNNDMDLRYDDFIEEIKISTTEQNMKKVPVEAYFTIRFKVNDAGLALFLPALENSECIHCLTNDTKANRMVEEFGEVEADRRGFRRWTDDEDMVLRNRVHVIKITDPKLEYDSSYCLYDNSSTLNGGYKGGDGASWQRYTESPPIPCMLHIDPLEYLLRIIPHSPLEHDTCYAVLLQNGVPCPPDFELDGPLMSFTHSSAVGDDKLIFFCTERGDDNYSFGMF